MDKSNASNSRIVPTLMLNAHCNFYFVLQQTLGCENIVHCPVHDPSHNVGGLIKNSIILEKKVQFS